MTDQAKLCLTKKTRDEVFSVMEDGPVELSIVIPLHNEAMSVKPLSEAILQAVAPLGYSFEAVLVDDGSTDDTFDRAVEIAEQDDRFRIIKLNKNCGQTVALNAGFHHARGDIIVTMDGDLQNDPADIGRLIRKMQEGYSVVTGWRENRQDRLIYRKIPSRLANWLVRKVTNTHIVDNGCALRVYRADVIKEFPLYSEMHRLLPTILALTGVRMAQIRVNHHPRKHGESKYGLSRIYKVLFDLVALKMVLTSVRLPLFGFGCFALLFAAFSLIAFGAGMGQVLFYPDSVTLVYAGAGTIWAVLAVSMWMLGHLCSLIYGKGSVKVEDVLKVNEL